MIGSLRLSPCVIQQNENNKRHLLAIMTVVVTVSQSVNVTVPVTVTVTVTVTLEDRRSTASQEVQPLANAMPR